MTCSDRIAAALEVRYSMQGDSEDTTQVFTGKVADASNRKKAAEFRDVSLRYDTESGRMLSHTSSTAYAGGTAGTIGDTDGGKSSPMNLIPRFYDTTAGEVVVFGEGVRKLTLGSLYAVIGIVLQRAELSWSSIASNLHWGEEGADSTASWGVLTVTQAREYAETRPGMLDFHLEQNIRSPSDGQKQRLMIAHALMKEPEILILNDGALVFDSATDAALHAAIRESAKDTICFIVSRRAASMWYTDQILVLNDRQLVGSGTYEGLLRDDRVYRGTYYPQFPKEV